MKQAVIALLVLLLAASTSMAGRFEGCDISISSLRHWQIDDVDYQIDRGSLVIYYEGIDFDNDEIEITRDYELFLNGEEVELTPEQQQLVTEYYDQTMEIVREAKRIGWQGVRIGLSGAVLGLKAVGGVVKMLFTGYDEDDLERDLEREADILEAKAERLESKAEALEDMAEELDDLAIDMREQIPVLRELEWF